MPRKTRAGRPCHGLFSNAERRKHSADDIIRGYRADEFAEMVEGEPQVSGDQFGVGE